VVFIRRIRIRNVRVFRDVTVGLSRATVLVGDNNSGKSSILDSIINFSNVGRGNFRLPAEGKYSFDALRSQAPDADGFIEYEAEVGESGPLPLTYVLRYAKDGSGLVVEREVLSLGNNVLFDRDDPTAKALTSVSNVGDNETVLSAIRRAVKGGEREDSHAVEDFAKAIANMMTFRLVPYVMAQPAPIPEDGQTFVPRLSGNGFGLATLLAYLHESTRSSEIEAYGQIVTRLKTTIDGFDSFVFTQSDADKVEFSVSFDDARGTIRASQLSDGSLSLIGHMALLCSPTRPGVVCLEEPESGLTIRALRALMRAVQDATSSDLGKWPSQVIIATHSPYVVSWAWENFGHEAIYETSFLAGEATVELFSRAHPDIAPDGALGPQAVVTAMGWQFG
jgi:predicted ATPase